MRFASTNILVLDNNRKVIYQSWKKESDLQDFSVGNFDENQYFVHETKILDKDSEVIGYLLALAKKEDTSLINALINKAAIVGFAMSLLISILIAFIFERNLINPVNRLKHNISKFRISGENKWEDINTKDEIADLNTEFKNMAQNLVKYDRQQKDFFQNSSHELKTPLMSIHGYAEAIKDGVVSPQDIVPSLDIIIEETNKLAEIVNNIMYLTRLDDNTDAKDKINEINLKDFIEEILSRFEIILNERAIIIRNNVGSDIKIDMEEEHLFRIFSNLISNSIRYAKSEIIIESETDNGIIIRLCDDGTGFEEKELPHVFERFFKGDRGKTGLGLSIVKSTVENYNGTVYAYNRNDTGACVEIHLNKQMNK